MSREWKPGDVAMVTDTRGKVRRAVRGKTRNSHIPCWWLMDTFTWVTSVGNARPLLVIDPEDREQVERLADVMEEWHGRIPYSDVREEGDLDHVTATQAALRSLLDPKPDEPTGLGAVVRDRDGDRWVHCRQPGHRGLQGVEWENERTCAHNRWSDIDVASEDDILSEGVIV